jgi:DNA-binding XRE family transcriptional regulator
VSQSLEISPPDDAEDPPPGGPVVSLRHLRVAPQSDECACVRINGSTRGREQHRLFEAADIDCEAAFLDANGDSPLLDTRAEIAKVLPRLDADLGRSVLKFRERAGLSQQELADHACVPVDTVQQVEMGHGPYVAGVRLIIGIEQLLSN